MNEYSTEAIKDILLDIDMNEMFKVFLESGLISEITGDYHEDTYNMCMNASTWLCKEMCEIEPYLKEDDMLHFVEGSYMGSHHVWLEIDNIIVDPTLAQFIASAPKVAILDSTIDCGYNEGTRYNILDWAIHCEEEVDTGFEDMMKEVQDRVKEMVKKIDLIGSTIIDIDGTEIQI